MTLKNLKNMNLVLYILNYAIMVKKKYHCINYIHSNWFEGIMKNEIQNCIELTDQIKLNSFYQYMIKKLKSKFQSEDNKRLLLNFISLSVLQGVNYILPLITLPYLVRVLGVEYFGLLAFTTAVIAYFVILTDYGFNLTATKEISIHRENKQKITEIFSSVMTIKILLMFVSFFLLSILVFSFEKFSEHWEMYFLTFGTVVGHVLFPVWFFQGIEKMKYITYINISSKLFFTIAIFIFVQEKSDFYIVPILSSIGTILCGVYALYFIRTNFNTKFAFQNTNTLIYYLSEAHHIFISNLAISLYTVSTTFILGVFTNNTIVGYFAAGDKIIQAFKGLMGPISQTIYPYIAKKTNQSKEEGLKFIKKVTFYIAIFTACVSTFIFFGAEFIVNLLLGADYQSSIIVVQLLSLMPFMIGLSNMFGIQTMLNFGRKKSFSQILIIGSILNIILSFILVPLYQYVGSAISVVVVESFITLAMFIYLQRSGLKLIGGNENV